VADIAAAAPKHWRVIYDSQRGNHASQSIPYCRNIEAEVRIPENTPADSVQGQSESDAARDVTCDEPGNTGMEVRGVVRAEYCPRKRKTGDSCPETEDLGRGGRGCWDVNEVFAADSRGDDEHDKDGNPSTFFVPTGGRRRAEVVIPSENDICTN